MYIDDYGILDPHFLIMAAPLNPCLKHPPEPPEWGIALLLCVGQTAFRESFWYPSRALRDKAFEELGAHTKRVDDATASEEERDEQDEFN